MPPFVASTWTQVPNDFFDNISNFSGAETKVILAILRKTSGFHKKTDRISVSQIMEITGLCNRVVIAAGNSLHEQKYITKVSKPTGCEYSLLVEPEREVVTKSHKGSDEKSQGSQIGSDEKSHTKEIQYLKEKIKENICQNQDSQPETLSTINNNDEVIDVAYTPIDVDNQNNNPASQTVDISIQSQLETKITINSKKEHFYEDALQVWNQHKRPEWTNHRTFTTVDKRRLNEFANYFKGSDLLTLLTVGLKHIAGQNWTWYKNYTFANISSNEKLIKAVEASQQTGGLTGKDSQVANNVRDVYQYMKEQGYE